MSNLEQIESAILSLPSNDFETLRLWFFDLDYQRWNEQIEQDIADGRLDALAQEAIAPSSRLGCDRSSKHGNLVIMLPDL